MVARAPVMDAAADVRVVQAPRLLNGAEAMGVAYWLAGARLAYTFPITPQSEVIDYFAAHPDIRCIQADSEYNVISGAQGVLWGGERCALATASQGLILMSEVMWEVAGNRLPMVMGVFSRGLKGPGWCLGTQQNDALFYRDTGWLQLYCESAQEILDFTLIAHRLAERISLPVMVVGDGFYLSHELEEVQVPTAPAAREFVGEPRRESIPVDSPPASYGALVPPERYSSFYQTMHRDMERAAADFEDLSAEFSRLFGRRYALTSGSWLEDAEVVLVTAGAISGTAREVIGGLREQGQRVGLLKLQSFRPFPADEAVRQLASAGRILVIDRNISPGLGGIFAAHLRAALHERRITIPVWGMVAGLGGLDVTPDMIERAIAYTAQAQAPGTGPLFLTESGIG